MLASVQACVTKLGQGAAFGIEARSGDLKKKNEWGCWWNPLGSTMEKNRTLRSYWVDGHITEKTYEWFQIGQNVFLV